MNTPGLMIAFTALQRVFLLFITITLVGSPTGLADTFSTENSAKGAGKKEEMIELNPFAVTMTQDRGYNAPNSGLALKTNEPLIKIPQSVTVMSRDMLDDIAADNTSDALGYAGLSNFFQGDSASLRGVRVNMLVDGIQDPSFFDPVIVDSLTIVRGPAAVLYGQNGSLGGAVIKNTRVPTGRKEGSLSVQTDQWGFLRTELDYNQPIAKIGESEFSLRFSGVDQHGQNYFKVTANNRTVGYLMMQMKRPNTTLRFAATVTEHRHNPTRNMFLTPEGLPFEGAGRREDFLSPASQLKRHDTSFRLIMLHSFSRDWNMSLRATAGRNNQFQPITLIGTANYQTRTVNIFSRLNHLSQQNYAASIDLNGKYELFGLPMTTSTGFLLNDNTNNPNNFPVNTTFGTDNAGRGDGFFAFNASNLSVPMDNPQTDKIYVAPKEYYEAVVQPTARGVRQWTYQTNLYVQQNVELFKEKLILVGSAAQFNHFFEQDNLSTLPSTTTTATIQRTHALLHRLGLVYMIVPGVGLYALDSQHKIPQFGRLIDGAISPPQDGTGREFGLKADLFNSRLTATLGFFDIALTNVQVAQVGNSPITNQPYVALIGSTKQRGADISLAAQPLPNLQLTFNAYKGSVKDQYGNGKLPSTFTGSVAFYGRYAFTSSALKKFAIGGGANRQYGRYVSATGIRLPDGTVPPSNGSPGGTPVLRLKDGTNTQLFVDYYATKNLTLKVSVNNVLDDFFVVGYQHSNSIDPLLPRTVNFFAKYRF